MLKSNKLFEETHEIFRETVKRFVKKHVIPHHKTWEKDGVVSRPLGEFPEKE